MKTSLEGPLVRASCQVLPPYDTATVRGGRDHRPWPRRPDRPAPLARGRFSMIEVLQDMPAGVVGIQVSGRITAEDFHQFKPTLDQMLDSDGSASSKSSGRTTRVSGPGDCRRHQTGLQHPQAPSRVQTHRRRHRQGVDGSRHPRAGLMIPGEVEVFGLDQLGKLPNNGRPAERRPLFLVADGLQPRGDPGQRLGEDIPPCPPASDWPVRPRRGPLGLHPGRTLAPQQTGSSSPGPAEPACRSFSVRVQLVQTVPEVSSISSFSLAW